jgi:cytochrome c oxidase subunit 2
VVSLSVLGAIFACTALFTDGVKAAPAPAPIELTTTRFAYTPNEITVKVGEPVELEIKSTDVTHGLRIHELGVDTKVDKGKTTQVSFTPTEAGDFVGQCSVFCGSGHGGMKLTVHVVK